MGVPIEPRLRVVIVGTGRMGRALARACAAGDVVVAAAGGRGDDPAALLELEPAAVLLAVPDREVEAVLGELGRATGGTEPLVLVTSGAVSIDQLRASAPTLRIARMHPMQTLTLESPADALDGVTAAITAQDTERFEAHLLAERLGMVPFDLPDERAATWHAAGVLASGCVTTLLAAARRCAVEAGLDETRAADAVGRLARTTVERVLAETAEDAMTGPVVRADAGTVAAHVGALRSGPADVLASYAALAALATRFAREAGRIDDTQAAELRAALGGAVPTWA